LQSTKNSIKTCWQVRSWKNYYEGTISKRH